MLGLAAKAGKLTYGCQLVCTAIRSGRKPLLVVLSNNASNNTVKRVTNCCEYYKCNLITGNFTSDELAHATGKDGSIACIGVNDLNFSTEIEKRLKVALSEIKENV